MIGNPAIHNLIGSVLELLGSLRWLVLLIGRLAVGYMFTSGALHKVQDLQGFGDWFGTLGIPFPHFNAFLAVYTELIGGICLMLGLGSRIFSFMLAFVMAVALWTVGTQSGIQYKITEQAVAMLQSAGVPDTVVQSLKGIQDQQFTDKAKFSELVKTTIGNEPAGQYESVIVQHARIDTKTLSVWIFKAESLLILIFMGFMTIGPGPVSVDYFIARKAGFANTT